ncbi:hypothetical protein [Prevotella ihumii]|uniref:hypothetical protein n=1 Tax=Prevotella ihumii TaxID=1917878 RepID=UPI0012B53F5C|nr:hypothetical protein [Prevotella ihumii]
MAAVNICTRSHWERHFLSIFNPNRSSDQSDLSDPSDLSDLSDPSDPSDKSDQSNDRFGFK